MTQEIRLHFYSDVQSGRGTNWLWSAIFPVCWKVVEKKSSWITASCGLQNSIQGNVPQRRGKYKDTDCSADAYTFNGLKVPLKDQCVKFTKALNPCKLSNVTV